MYHFIINPGSRTGKGIKIWHTIENHLKERQVSYDSHFTSPKFSATKIMEKICEKDTGIKRIIILGGDGTFNEAINGLSTNQVEQVYFGYIPTGSSNDFARSLRLPKDPLVGLNNILSAGHFLTLDIGELTMDSIPRKFVVSSGVGFDAAICRASNKSKLKLYLNHIGLGKFIYVVKAVTQLVLSPFMDGEITVDDNKKNTYHKIFFVTSMIQLYQGGGLKFAPDANPADGKLSVCIAHGMSRFKLFFMLLRLVAGKHGGVKGIELLHCTNLSIKLQKKADVHTDGEYPGSYTNYEVSCLKGKLKLMV